MPDNDRLYLFKNDPDYNTFNLRLTSNQLQLTRPPAIANIYLQMMDKDFNWTQEVIDQDQTLYEKSLENIQIVRIDYPPHLWNIDSIEEWQWDNDKQLDRIQ